MLFVLLVLGNHPATAPVLLGGAADFAILTKTGISTVPSSSITGNIGCSPIGDSGLTGFSLVADDATAGQFSRTTQVTGMAYAANFAVPTPSKLTTAISDLETAYTDAAGRTVSSGANLNVGAGSVAGETFTAGVYTWGSNVNFNSKIYINGSKSDIFIFQMSGNLIVAADAEVVLEGDGTGNGEPKNGNIVWQVAGHVEVGANAHMEGVILVKTHAAFLSGSSLNGRILAQTAATLDQATIVAPPPPANTGQSNNEFEVNKTNNNLIVGLVVGLGGGLVLLAMLAFFYYKYRLIKAAKTKAAVPVNEVVIAPAGVTVANSKRV
mmetsp:Transcript_43267/g.100248  ORF Transcript_43267/g.100248 Transcript_43267/m.100248 type:complete len:324 (+) Transcript_43267:169-1140(+)